MNDEFSALDTLFAIFPHVSIPAGACDPDISSGEAARETSFAAGLRDGAIRNRAGVIGPLSRNAIQILVRFRKLRGAKATELATH